MLEASEKKIRWILFESGIRTVDIARAVGASRQQIYGFQSGNRKIEKMNFTLASRLSSYYDGLNK
ncbi:hypothetical protein [Limosilactobacillus frumenti]|uniref:hypothetical protein n=1 Tax=Limosilactobacillus frumenti TaxID=104955 RepID=UPI00070A143C|nr:hypothetical protein [Limosilactobacillus frumenti]QFG72753.1 hypothetical protein LF145_05120 [Limosilactobacillus frumenti]